MSRVEQADFSQSVDTVRWCRYICWLGVGRGIAGGGGDAGAIRLEPYSTAAHFHATAQQAHYRDYGQMTYARALFVIHNIAHQGRGP